MRVALGEKAGLGLGVLWMPKELAGWLLLVGEPGEARGFQSFLSVHCQLAELVI